MRCNYHSSRHGIIIQKKQQYKHTLKQIQNQQRRPSLRPLINDITTTESMARQQNGAQPELDINLRLF